MYSPWWTWSDKICGSPTLTPALRTAAQAAHVGVAAFVVLSPAARNMEHAYMNLMLGPFIVMHWVMHTDMCVFSHLEAKLTGQKVADTCVYSVVGPIFNFYRSGMSGPAQAVILASWLATVYRVVASGHARDALRHLTRF